MVEQSSFILIALFWLEIGRCRGRNWLNGNQALSMKSDRVRKAGPKECQIIHESSMFVNIL